MKEDDDEDRLLVDASFFESFHFSSKYRGGCGCEVSMAEDEEEEGIEKREIGV